MRRRTMHPAAARRETTADIARVSSAADATGTLARTVREISERRAAPSSGLGATGEAAS